MRHLDVCSRLAASLLLAGFGNAACAGNIPSDAASTPGADLAPGADAIVITAILTSAGYALAGPEGLTLYMLTKDHDGTSSCTTGRCAEAWEALKGDAAQVRPGAGVSGTFGTTKWIDGTTQITHNGQPLYYFHSDEFAGEAKGHGRGGVWCVAPVAYSRCGVLVAPSESVRPAYVPGPAQHASENSDGEY
jgi:predicted lipoprotein with Yx(FWY)xxD motif